MTEPTPTADDATRREQAKTKVTEAAEVFKTELAARLDQFLDEIGALI